MLGTVETGISSGVYGAGARELAESLIAAQDDADALREIAQNEGDWLQLATEARLRNPERFVDKVKD